MIAEIAAGVGALAGIGGWIFAWRARGEALDARKDANAAAAQQRIAEVETENQRRRADVAELTAATANTRADAATSNAAAARGQLERERKGWNETIEHLAQAGVAVGDALVDGALDQLYPNRDRGKAGGGEGAVPSGGGALSDEPTGPARPAR